MNTTKKESPAVAPTTGGADEKLDTRISVKKNTAPPIALHLPHRTNGRLAPGVTARLRTTADERFSLTPPTTSTWPTTFAPHNFARFVLTPQSPTPKRSDERKKSNFASNGRTKKLNDVACAKQTCTTNSSKLTAPATPKQ